KSSTTPSSKQWSTVRARGPKRSHASMRSYRGATWKFRSPTNIFGITCPDLRSSWSDRMRIVIPDDSPPVMMPSSAYRKLDGYDVRTYSDRPSSDNALTERIRDAEIVINIRSTSRFTAEALKKCDRLRLISIWGTGTDNVDLAAAKAREIRVTNTPGVSAIAVAEHTLALIMAVAKQTVQADQQVRQGNWPRSMV